MKFLKHFPRCISKYFKVSRKFFLTIQNISFKIFIFSKFAKNFVNIFSKILQSLQDFILQFFFANFFYLHFLKLNQTFCKISTTFHNIFQNFLEFLQSLHKFSKYFSGNCLESLQNLLDIFVQYFQYLLQILFSLTLFKIFTKIIFYLE